MSSLLPDGSIGGPKSYWRGFQTVDRNDLGGAKASGFPRSLNNLPIPILRIAPGFDHQIDWMPNIRGSILWLNIGGQPSGRLAALFWMLPS